jgi:uncharacterized membrane protein
VGSFFSIPINSMDRINIGAAVLPVIIALILTVVYRDELIPILVSIVGCTIVACLLASPALRSNPMGPPSVIGLQLDPIAMATFASVLVFLVTRTHVPIVAYIATTLGIFIGADLFHIHELPGAPGTFGGAGLMDGILDVPLLAVFFTAGVQSWVTLHEKDKST